MVGTAPSQELLDKWNEREGKAAAEGAEGLSLPKVSGAYVGQELDPELRERIYREGARTAPGREHGGNIDIGSLTRGSKMYLVGTTEESLKQGSQTASLCPRRQTLHRGSTLLRR